MTIFTVCFNYPDRPHYKILLDVFRKSVQIHMPKVNFISIEPTPPAYESDRIAGFLDNTFKLKYWIDFFKHTDDNIIFADCDLFAIRDGNHAFNSDFDIAYTAIKQPYKAKLNGGILMTKPTDAAYRFLQEFQSINDRMYQDIDFHEVWRKKYAGMNQAAFGCVLETGINGAKIHTHMTQEWNAVDRDLKEINDKTVFVHIKDRLRNMLIQCAEPQGVGEKVMREWYRVKNMIKIGKAV
jgi:hypothetical protein